MPCTSRSRRSCAVPSVLGHLEELARAHSVRVAYYVRPQHSWLESAWLQWGFRDRRPPDVWLRRQRSRLEYLQISDAIRRSAPHLSFEMRPFRSDLLEGGHVVSDFAGVFLGLDDLAPTVTRERWSNRSIPLEMAILLREAPRGLFWSNMHDNKTFYPLKRLVSSVEAAADGDRRSLPRGVAAVCPRDLRTRQSAADRTTRLGHRILRSSGRGCRGSVRCRARRAERLVEIDGVGRRASGPLQSTAAVAGGAEVVTRHRRCSPASKRALAELPSARAHESAMSWIGAGWIECPCRTRNSDLPSRS